MRLDFVFLLTIFPSTTESSVRPFSKIKGGDFTGSIYLQALIGCGDICKIRRKRKEFKASAVRAMAFRKRIWTHEMPTGDGSRAGAEDGATDGMVYETVAPWHNAGKNSHERFWIENCMIARWIRQVFLFNGPWRMGNSEGLWLLFIATTFTRHS